MATRPLYYCAWGALPQQSHSQSAPHRALGDRKNCNLSNDAEPRRSAPCVGRRRAPAPQKHQARSTRTARGPTVGSPRSGGQLRIRKRMTPASSSRISSIGRARPAPVATPDRRRGLSQTNASRARPTPRDADRRSPTRAGRRARLGAARGGGPRHRDGAAAARARPCLNRPLLAAAARASRVAMPAQALKDGEEAAEEIFQQDESVRSLDSRKNRRV